MKLTEIINKKTGEKYMSFGGDDIEKVNPAKHYYEACLISKMMILFPDETSGRKKATEKAAENLIKVSEFCGNHIDEIRKISIPDELIQLLKSSKKSTQKKLLNRLRITPDIFKSFLLEAGNQGFLFSQYMSEHQSSAINNDEMPLAYTKLDDNSIKIIGDTNLSKGQLKQALEQRSVKVANFLEKEDEWHCFFLTYNSLGGKENWQNGQPHFHYLSNLFGFLKKDVIKQIKSKKYNLGNLPHISIDDN